MIGETPLRAGLAHLLATSTVTLMDGREAVLVSDIATLLNPPGKLYCVTCKGSIHYEPERHAWVHNEPGADHGPRL